MQRRDFLRAIVGAGVAGATSALPISAPPAFASGGIVRSTGKSITLKLSEGEFCIDVSMIKHYGVDFMRALNEGRKPL